MKILVLVKQVPDTYEPRNLNSSNGWIVRAKGDLVLDEVGERAIEAALVAQESDGAEVVVATMGPASAADDLRKALAMGADSAVHVVDDSLAGSDVMRTARVLAAIARRVDADLVLTGNESTDGRGGVMAALVAEILKVPHASHLDELTIASGEVSGSRSTESGSVSVRASYPAVASVTERVPEARLPSFRGIMKAKKKTIEQLSLADLGVDDGTAASVIVSTQARPARGAGVTITDDGEAGKRIAEFLAEARLI